MPNIQALQEDTKKKILSIDGGGMRGAIPIGILMEIEEQTGKPAYEIFDFVAGTSIGAIITAGLAFKMSAQDILDVAFRDGLPKAFGDTGLINWIKFALRGFKYRYDLKPFMEVFQQYTTIKVGDIDHIGILMTTKDVRTGNTYFITNKGAGAEAFKDWTVAGATATSASAPIYFSPIDGNFIDGGVGSHGNPCFAVANETLKYIGEAEGYVDNNVVLYSLGTGYHPQSRPDGVAENWWILDWVQYLISEMIEDTALQAVYATRDAYGDRIDFRRYNPYLKESAMREIGVNTNGIDLSLLALDSTESEKVELMVEIGRAYARQIDWNRSGVMPWNTKGGHPQPELNTKTDWSDLYK